MQTPSLYQRIEEHRVSMLQRKKKMRHADGMQWPEECPGNGYSCCGLGVTLYNPQNYADP